MVCDNFTYILHKTATNLQWKLHTCTNVCARKNPTPKGIHSRSGTGNYGLEILCKRQSYLDAYIALRTKRCFCTVHVHVQA